MKRQTTLFDFCAKKRAVRVPSADDPAPATDPAPAADPAQATGSGPFPAPAPNPAHATGSGPVPAPAANPNVSSKDFGFVIGENVTDVQRFAALTDRWRPRVKTDIPASYHTKKERGKDVTRPRRVTLNHLNTFPWLAISRLGEHTGAWCSVCVLFGGSKGTDGKQTKDGQHLGRLVNKPLTDFSDLTGQAGALEQHGRHPYHLTNMTRAGEFQQRYQRPEYDVSVQVETASQRETERNRRILTAVVDTIKLAAVQNISMRGHRDDGRIDPSCTYQADNDGNFRALLRFRVQSGDAVLQKHLADAPGNALYTSKSVQNAILKDMAEMVKRKVASKVTASGVWAIMADETTDCANREQLALVVRYVDQHDGELVVREDPIGLIDVFAVPRQSAQDAEERRMSGANLAKVIREGLTELRLDTQLLVGQCYDGAAAMSSQRVGVSAQIQADAPLAHCFHCTAHALNLSTSLMDHVRIIANATETMEHIVVFITDGAKRGELLHHAQNEQLEDGKKQKLVKLCKTRFIERHVAIERFVEQLPAIHLALQLMTAWQDRRTSSKAAILLDAIAKIEFLVGLAVAQRLAGILRPLALALQVKGADLTASLELADTVTTLLLNIRENDEEFAAIWEEITTQAARLQVEVKKPRLPGRCTHRDNAGADLSVQAFFRVNVFNPAIDGVREDMKSRFGEHQRKAFKLGQLLPKKVKKASWSQLEPVWAEYRSLLDCTETQLKHEFEVWAALWRRRPDVGAPVTAIGTLNECSVEVFPHIHKLLRVLAVLPASTAEAERVFSKVTRTLTALRATMTEDRLEALVLLQAHRDNLPATSDVIDVFAASGARRLEMRQKLQ